MSSNLIVRALTAKLARVAAKLHSSPACMSRVLTTITSVDEFVGSLDFDDLDTEVLVDYFVVRLFSAHFAAFKGSDLADVPQWSRDRAGTALHSRENFRHLFAASALKHSLINPNSP